MLLKRNSNYLVIVRNFTASPQEVPFQGSILDFLSEKSEALANRDLLMLPQYQANLDVNMIY
jgi:hypothetical protein